MIATLISIAFALFMFLYPGPKDFAIDGHAISMIILALAFLIFLVQKLAYNFSFGPLQRAEKNVTSHLIQIFLKDRPLRFSNGYFTFFLLATFLLVISPIIFKNIPQVQLFALWIVLFGVALDVLHAFYRRLFNYLDPYSVIKLFTHAARTSVQEEKEEDLCDWIDALSESSLRAIQGSNISLCNSALQELQLITGNFLTSSKSISHQATDPQSQKMGVTDKISFTLFYIFQRLEMINDKAVECHLEPASSKVITTLGKIAVHAAKYDISLTSYPLYVLGKCAKRAQESNLSEVANKATRTLLQIAKTIPQEIDVTYLELKDTYLTIITQLHEIAQEAFRQDKSISISVLTEPFKELRQIFESEKLAGHQDTPAILEAVKQVQGEFDALELIMKTIPPLPDIPENPPEVAPATPSK
jgi:hypothetical protein